MLIFSPTKAKQDFKPQIKPTKLTAEELVNVQ